VGKDKGEGHRVDGRSDIFSLGVVFYELLTGRRPFRGDSHLEVMEQIATTEPRPPRQIDDTIPRELERICLKALAKRASERYSTAKDLAEDLQFFLQTAVGITSPVVAPGRVSPPPGSTKDVTPRPTTPRAPDPDRPQIKVVPKGLRSFDEHDADFFLELLPGPRDRDGLPESIRFWKTRIEETDADRTFRVGLIYGPSGCGKSSMVKAGLLPRLERHVVPIYIEATAEDTENRLLRGLRKACPDLSPPMGLVESLMAIRQGRVLRSGKKALLLLDQFEQWLHAKRSEENTELVAALRHCDGEHVQAVVLVRDDFWLAVSRFMAELEVELLQGQNTSLVDLFDPRHAHKVLTAFGTAYGNVPERTGEISRDRHAFLDRAVADLAQDGKVVPVRLALFAEMMKGKPWTPATLREVGGTEGVGLTFLEETFSSPQANPKHRFHQKAAQAVLKALLPATGTDIKGQMRSEGELQEAAAYADLPGEFADLTHILDNELRLITPTDPEGSDDERPHGGAGGRYYQLTHDYLVHSLRDWLTRRQRETRRGRAALRLAERSSLWNAKPENRRLPSALEWANIRLLTKRRDWTEPQRRMMKRAGRVHGLRTLGLVMVVSLISWGGMEGYGTLRASALVDSLQKVATPDVPAIVRQLSGYRRWADPQLVRVVRSTGDRGREHLHASLALLPVDATQVDYLFQRLLSATPGELPVLRDALKTHRTTLIPKLWAVLESANPGDAHLLPSASALASYDPDNARWGAVGGKLAHALASVNAILLGPWIEALRPVRGKLTAPLATIFEDQSRPESVHSLATDILTDYASDDPDRLAELLMVADPKSYQSLFPVAQRQADRTLPLFLAELAKRATYSWNDPPLDPTWTRPDATLVSRIESAQGILAERFAFCQTMPMDDLLTTAEALRKSGYRPMRFRPYADGGMVRVAAVWTRDGRNWRWGWGLSPEQIRHQNEKYRDDKFVPGDVAGYMAIGKDDKPAERYAALWVERAGVDDARMYVGTTATEETEVQDKLTEAKLIPRTTHAMIGSEGRTRSCGVWGRPSGAAIEGQSERDRFEGNFEQKQADLSDQLLLDIAVSGASKPQTIRDRAQAALERAEKRLKTKPDDLDSRLARAVANFRLGENPKALDDLQVVIGKNPEAISAKQYRVVALARLGQKQGALSELARFQKEDASESAKLSLAAVVAAGLGEGADKALEALEAAIKKRPKDSDLRYDAARAFSLVSKGICRSDRRMGRQLAGRSLQLLRELVKDGDVDFGKMDEEADLDPIRDDPAFAEIMKGGHPDRRYSAVWTSDATSFEAVPLYGLDPAAHLRKCRELIAHGYRPISWSASRTAAEGPLVTASVWHRPVITEQTKERLAERQARAAIALARMGKAEQVWPLLRHNADPRMRSFIVNWLNPLGADPGLIAAALERMDTDAKPTSTQGRQAMDGILFHPETSMRRALILALGTYGMDGLSPGEREPLSRKLLDLYRNDPDSGIHGSAEWTLRQWKQQEKLKELDAELTTLEDWGERRWYINCQGQTYVVIEGPVEFRMGSPPTEPNRNATKETPRRLLIPHRFAIAARGVTIEQWRRFERTHPKLGLPPSYVNQYSPDPDGPMIGFNWYIAANYCNWLSEQEGLPKDQWCYLPNEAGAYAEGMTVPADVLRRSGYRLPTEPEWEFSCRSGTVTSRYFGLSTELLGKYAWYQANSDEHARSCGSLQPNELGLFDMLGNELEWVQDSLRRPMRERRGLLSDTTDLSEVISDKLPRLLRGGSFDKHPFYVRSAYRFGIAPASRVSIYGFRPSRTYH
jgi:formylglycine-generating enzyme required for sulfatase activity/tetratricopeptide (TPR) repeat protein